MPGISLIVARDTHRSRWQRALEQTSSVFSPPVEHLFCSPAAVVRYAGYDGYPFYFHDAPELLVCFEGVVYDRALEPVRADLRDMGRRLAAGEDILPRVRDFVSSSDGDFLCVLYAKDADRLVVFNDRLARLPAYVHASDGCLAVCRETKFLLPAVDSIRVDRRGLAEYLMLGYSLGGRTFFRDVHRLPGSSFVAAQFDAESAHVAVRTEELASLGFDDPVPGPSRRQCVEDLFSLHIESVERRVARCVELGLPPIADVSGGFDTRTVLGLLESIGAKATYFTHHLVTGDESKVARRLCDLFGRRLELIEASHDVDESGYEAVVYETDGHVNGWTALTSWVDVVAKRERTKGPTACFMGFGGEFIRHPLQPAWGCRDLGSMLRSGRLGTALPPERAARLAGLAPQEFLALCEAHFASYPETSLAGRLKRYYSEYYHALVLHGEDRKRRLFWTVQPLWSVPLQRYERSVMPLRHADYAFHAAFLRALDPRLVQVPIHGSHIPLGSPIGCRLYAARTRVRNQVKPFLAPARVRSRLSFRRKIGRGYSQAAADYTRRIREVYGSSEGGRRVVPEGALTEFLVRGDGIQNYDRLLTVLVYFQQIERRLGLEIHGDEGT